MTSRTGRPGPRALTLGVTAAVVLAVAALVVTAAARTDPGAPPGPGPAAPAAPVMPDVSVTQAVQSLAVLRAWDAARAEAWSRGDAADLRRLYTHGSVAGRRDVGMLRRWIERGLVVRRMTMQVVAVELRARTQRRIVLLVTDRLSDAVAVRLGGGRPQALPRDGMTTRRLAFVRRGGEWRLASAYVRPLATTAVTSGSRGS